MFPYCLVYEKICHLLVEIEHRVYWAIKEFNMNFSLTSHKRLLQLSELEEFQLSAYENTKIYRKK